MLLHSLFSSIIRVTVGFNVTAKIVRSSDSSSDCHWGSASIADSEVAVDVDLASGLAIGFAMSYYNMYPILYRRCQGIK